jgi:hypothetical protein
VSFLSWISAIARIQDNVTGRRRTSAMTPITFYVVSSASICFGAAYAFRENSFLTGAFSFVGLFIVLVGGAIAVYFAGWKTDRLQTEDHLTTLKQLEMVASKGGKIPVNPVDLQAIGNPYSQSSDGEEGRPGAGLLSKEIASE